MVKKSKPVVINGVRYVDEAHHIEETTELIRKLELAEGFSAMHENVYKRCGVINRALREALENATNSELGDLPFEEFSRRKQQIADAKALPPAAAEEIVNAMDDVIAEAGKYHTGWEQHPDVEAAIEKLEEVKKRHFKSKNDPRE